MGLDIHLGIQRARRLELLLRIVAKAIEMRKAQKEFLKFKSPTNLTTAKTAEREFDALLDEWAGFEIAQRRRRGEPLKQIMLDLRGAADDHSH